jgi:cell wall-associated NlpC family hydrolase
MAYSKQLFCCLFLALTLSGCGTVPQRSAAPSHESAPAASRPAGAGEALFHALATLDIDYRYGGHSPASGFDCSGLVMYVYQAAYGIALPRQASEQSRAGRAVERTRLAPGDLVFYDTLNQPYSHVGIYIGDGRFIHAPKTGAAVRVESMSSRYWTRRYNGARRILADG